MNQIFPPGTNEYLQVAIIGLVLGALSAGVGFYIFVQSPPMTGVGIVAEQPAPFSHEHHVRGLGIECQYCHTSVEETASAGIPPTHTCMTCHSVIWTNSPNLEAVRTSYQTNTPMEWNRVHDLSDFVYFNHSVHVNNGVGCETCHGQVDKMPLMWKNETLQMAWCLECHRSPEDYVRPQAEIYTMGWEPPASHDGLALVEEYGIEVGRLDNCSICHR